MTDQEIIEFLAKHTEGKQIDYFTVNRLAQKLNKHIINESQLMEFKLLIDRYLLDFNMNYIKKIKNF